MKGQNGITNKKFKSVSLQLLLMLFCCFFTWHTHAVNINFGPNGCTLQDAIRSANTDSAVGNCSSGSGRDILISPDVWPITLNSRLPTITSDMTITTTTPSGLLKISGDNDHAVMKITGASTEVTLQRVFITEADSTTIRGSGVHIEDAEVSLIDTIFSFNRTTARYGGAIYIEDGVLNIERSYLEFNRALNTGNALSEGGAIYAVDSEVNIDETRFVANEANSRLANIGGVLDYYDKGFGASIFMQGGELTVSHSLFNEPDSAIHGNQNIATIRNSTISRSETLGWEDQRGHVFFTDFSSLTLNHVTIKAAMRLQDSMLNMTNSILRGECNFANSINWIIDAGNIYNTSSFSCPDTINLFYNPQLLDLANNGGRTETFAIRYTSDALNAGDLNYCATTDQRGVIRDSACDIGAYEAVDFADIEVEGLMSTSGPHVHGQKVIYEAIVNNNLPALVNEVRIDLDTEHGIITSIDSALCSSFPCILTGIQGMQEVTIPIEITLSNFEDDFSVEITAENTTNSTYQDQDESNNSDFLSFSIIDGADLAIDMELLDRGNHFIGQVLEYRVLIDNDGFNSATNTTFVLAPTGLNVLAFDGCNSVTGNTCHMGTMNTIGNHEVLVQAQVTANEFDAVATVSSDVYDFDLSNNTDQTNNNGALGETDVSIDIVPSTFAPYYSYDYIAFDVKITTGNKSASNIKFWPSFPGSEFISCSETISVTGACTVSDMAANSVQFETIQYFNPITSGASQQMFPITVVVEPGETDTDLSNNSSTMNVTIQPASDVAAQLSLVTPPPYFSGQELQFELRVVNGGVNHATSLDVEMVADNLALVWEAGNLCQSRPCVISQLDRFNEENITLVYRITDAGAFSLTASAHANQDDLNPNNNSDQEQGVAELTPDDLIFEDSFEQ